MPETLDFTILRGCDYRLRTRMVTPPDTTEVGSLNTWTVVFEVRQVRGGSPVLTVNGALSTIPQANTLGVFDFTLTANNTASLTDRTYFYAVRRTDTGFVDVLSRGLLGVESF